MNCDPIARWYGTLEYLSFGRALLDCRFGQLLHCRSAQRVLMLGEGDGRFLERFLRTNSQAEVDYVDGSARMLAIARARLSAAQQERVRFYQADARQFVPGSGYDLIVTHFFLDCLFSREAKELAEMLTSATTPGARWIVSEFYAPERGWRRLRARLWICSLYAAFRWLTRLRVSEIPDYRSALQGAGFSLTSERRSSAELLTSQLWQKAG